MNTNGHKPFCVNGQLYNLNRRKFSFEDLTPYAGRYVAFNSEGTKILAQGGDHLEVAAQLRILGVDLAEAVLERIPEVWEDTWL